MTRTKAITIKTCEELGELIQILCKATNDHIREKEIEHEIGDVLGCISLLIKEMNLDKTHIQDTKEKRIRKHS